MKSILLTTLVVLSLGCLQVNAQYEKRVNLNSGVNPGDELRKASSHYYIGLGTVAGGIFMISAGAAAESAEAITLGVIAFVVGEVFMIEAWSHIGKAGRLMQYQQKSSFNIHIKGNGVGLAYHF